MQRKGKILVTGTAGFIGFHVANRLLSEGHEVVGLDSINDYYDVNLKYARLSEAGVDRDKIDYGQLIRSTKNDRYRFVKLNLEDTDQLLSLFSKEKFNHVCHLAAQAGVRYSIENPYTYIESNIVGFINILEGCRHDQVKHLVYASSSSVYGLNKKMPLSTEDAVDHPISLYAATKRSNELMAHSYSHLYGLPTTGLRFFTVYGPWGRPDMAYYIFTKRISEGDSIDVYNQGKMARDFTYIDDIVDGVMRVMFTEPDSTNEESPASSPTAKFEVYNIGNSQTVQLGDLIDTIEKEINIKAKINYRPLQPGDVLKTHSDISPLMDSFGYKPGTPIEKGIKNFVIWYRQYYGI